MNKLKLNYIKIENNEFFLENRKIVFNEGINFIVMGPGTGKTTIVNAIIFALGIKNIPPILQSKNAMVSLSVNINNEEYIFQRAIEKYSKIEIIKDNNIFTFMRNSQGFIDFLISIFAPTINNGKIDEKLFELFEYSFVMENTKNGIKNKKLNRLIIGLNDNPYEEMILKKKEYIEISKAKKDKFLSIIEYNRKITKKITDITDVETMVSIKNVLNEEIRSIEEELTQTVEFEQEIDRYLSRIKEETDYFYQDKLDKLNRIYFEQYQEYFDFKDFLNKEFRYFSGGEKIYTEIMGKIFIQENVKETNGIGLLIMDSCLEELDKNKKNELINRIEKSNIQCIYLTRKMDEINNDNIVYSSELEATVI